MESASDLIPLSDNEISRIEDGALDLTNTEFEDGEIDYGIIEEAEKSTKPTSPKRYFTILNESDIKRLQDFDIINVLSVLLISRAAACLLLYHYEWCVSKVIEAWFDNEEKVRKAIGLQKHPEVMLSCPENLECEICNESSSSDNITSAKCGHLFCNNCWQKYMDRKIDEGPRGCLALRCPNYPCDAVVDQDMIHKLASTSSKEKYDRFLLRSYVDNNKQRKWCPAPNCEYAICYEANCFRKHSDVTCLCYHSFCWYCGEEAHTPVDCNTMVQWIKNNNYECASTSWILLNTKPCPNCRAPIEKDFGCYRMYCICGFEFCWSCLKGWSLCRNIDCDPFPGREVQGATKLQVGIDVQEDGRDFKENREIHEEEIKKKNYLEKYKHCYENWTKNEVYRKRAHLYLIETSTVHINNLSMSYGKPEIEFEFLKDMCQQIVDGRSVLKWTYVYGYYFPKNNESKLSFFECLKEEARVALERLEHYAENEVIKFLKEGPVDNFFDFRMAINNLTKATNKYFKNLVKAIVNGLDDEGQHLKNYAGFKRRSSEIGESSHQREVKH